MKIMEGPHEEANVAPVGVVRSSFHEICGAPSPVQFIVEAGSLVDNLTSGIGFVVT
jgi:hypothetical protein